MRWAGNKNYPGQTAANNEIESVQYCAEDRTEDEVSKVTGHCKGRFISTWSTDNWSIADVSVSSDGTCNITAGKTTGKTRIHIYLNSGYEKSVTVKVQKTAVKTTKIKGVPKTLKLKKNQKYSLKPV